MFCGNCGTQNPDNAPFCTGCGAKLNEAPVAPASAPEFTPEPTRKSRKGLFIGIGAAVVAIAVALILIFTLGGGKGGAKTAEDVVEEYIKAAEEVDGEAIMDLIHENILEKEFSDEDEREEAIEEFEKGLGEIMEMCEIQFEIGDSESLDGDDLEDLQEEYEEDYDLEVEDAEYIEVIMTIEVYGYEQTQTNELLVIKVDGKWYLAEFD